LLNLNIVKNEVLFNLINQIIKFMEFVK